jgi:hypothetical protein
MDNAGIELAISAVGGEEHTKPSLGSVRRTVLCSVRQLRIRPRDTTCVLEATNDTRTSAHPRRFTCKSPIFVMKPRGFEPLTSTVQSQIYNFVAVRWCSEISAKWCILSEDVSCLFAVVRVGWCTTGVHEPWEARSYRAMQTMLSHPT